MIASILPLEVGYKAALQVKKNIDDGIRYVYYLHGNPDDAQKICRLLQMMLLAPMLDPNKPIGYRYLQSEVKQNKNRIVQDLEQICARESLKIFFLPGSPELEYLIYNADSVDKAVLYFKHRGQVHAVGNRRECPPLLGGGETGAGYQFPGNRMPSFLEPPDSM